MVGIIFELWILGYPWVFYMTVLHDSLLVLYAGCSFVKTQFLNSVTFWCVTRKEKEEYIYYYI